MIELESRTEVNVAARAYNTAKTKDDYPTTFPDSGNWKTKVYACSIKGTKPSRYMTWFQAQLAGWVPGAGSSW